MSSSVSSSSSSSSSLKDLLGFLSAIEDSLDQRIEHVEAVNSRLRTNKKILKEALSCAAEEHTDDTVSAAGVTGVQLPPPPQGQSHHPSLPTAADHTEVVSLPNKLDEILNLAKIIRDPKAGKGVDTGVGKSASDNASVASTSSSKQSVATSSNTSTLNKRLPDSVGKYKVMSKPPVTSRSSSASSSSQARRTTGVSSAAGKACDTSSSVKERPQLKPQPLYQALIQKQENLDQEENTKPVQEDGPKLPSPRHQVEQQLFLLNKQRYLSRFKTLFVFSPKLIQSQTSILKNTKFILSVPMIKIRV